MGTEAKSEVSDAAQSEEGLHPGAQWPFPEAPSPAEGETPETALHSAIMNLPSNTRRFETAAECLAYAVGHRDARHAAAERALQSAPSDGDPNALWLTAAHMLCTDNGIPQGNITARIEALREKLSAPSEVAQAVAKYEYRNLDVYAEGEPGSWHEISASDHERMRSRTDIEVRALGVISATQKEADRG